MSATNNQRGRNIAAIMAGARRLKPSLLITAIIASGLMTGTVSGTDKPATMGQPIEIYLDLSRVIKVPDRTATLVVGNPLIADVSVETGGLLVVTGKGYGVTNVMAFDAKGALLMEHPIEVKGPVDRVTVYRGVNRESYSCLPDCERRVVLGDTQDFFTSTLNQASTLNTQASQGSRNGAGGSAR